MRGQDGHTRHGIECDHKYIYFLQSGVRFNWIWIYDWDGDFVKKLKLPMLGEGANLFIRDGKLVVAFNNKKDKTGDVYEFRFSRKK